MSYDADLFVIGAGSGGVRAARFAGSLGAKVIVAEAGPLGGTCVNVGCVPKKLMVYASEYGEVVEDAKGFGWSFTKPRFDWSQLIENKDKEISRLNGIYQHLLERTGVEIVRGFATFVDEHTVKVGDKTYTAERILIATGGHPVRPSIPGAELGLVSDDLFTMKELPKSIAIVGGGYIGVEFAGILNGVGVETVVLQRSAHVLRGFDQDIQVTLRDEMRKKGIDVRVETTVIHVLENDDGTLCVDLDDKTQLNVDCLMWATGRAANTSKLNLQAAGVKVRDNGSIIVEGDDFQTSVSHIHAVGDVIGTPELTPVALEQGMAFAKRHYGEAKDTVDLTILPTAVFSQPCVGTVGLTQQQAREQDYDFDIYRSRFRAMRHTMTGREEKSMMKLIVDKKDDRVLGCHMVGPDAGEIIQGLAVAMQAGATKAMFDATLGIHPTAAEEFVTMRHPVTEDLAMPEDLSTVQHLLNTVPQQGTVEWIGLSPARRAPINVVEHAVIEVGTGLVGDRHALSGRGIRQVTLIQAEHIEAIRSMAGIDALSPTDLRRNVVVRGLNLLALRNKTFRLGTAVLKHTGPCDPCTRMEENLGPGGFSAMRGHGGITASVVEAGEVRVGDKVVAIASDKLE